MIKHIKSMLTKDENILHDSRVHWVVFIKPFVYASLALIIAVFFHPLVGGVILVMDFYAFYVAATFYQTTHLILTEKKVLGRTGYLSRDWSQLKLGHIETAYLREPILGRYLGYSSIIIRGTGVGVIAFPYLLDGDVFVKKLESLIDKNEKKENIINITLPSSPQEMEYLDNVQAIRASA